MSHPELLILDERTSGLDPVLQEEFRELLAERKAGGASIWLTSHVMAEVERAADRVGLIRDGVLVRELSLDELRHQAGSRIRLTVPTCGTPAKSAAVTPSVRHPLHLDRLARVRGAAPHPVRPSRRDTRARG
jgi:ABC-2 type transport system ATP-binding protein